MCHRIKGIGARLKASYLRDVNTIREIEARLSIPSDELAGKTRLAVLRLRHELEDTLCRALAEVATYPENQRDNRTCMASDAHWRT